MGMKLFLRPYEHFTQAELTEELKEKVAILLDLAKTAKVVVDAWAGGFIDEPFNFKMLRVCREPARKARLLRHLAREAHARGMKPAWTKKSATKGPDTTIA